MSRLQENLTIMGFSFGKHMESGEAKETTGEDAMKVARADIHDMIRRYPHKDAVDRVAAEDIAVSAIEQCLTSLTERLARSGLPDHEMMLAFAVSTATLQAIVSSLGKGAIQGLTMHNIVNNPDLESIIGKIVSVLEAEELAEAAEDTKH